MEGLEPLLTYLQDPATPYGVLDPIYAIFLLYGLVRGLFRGFPEELAQLLGTVVVFVGAHFLYRPVSGFLIEHTRLERPEASLALAYLLMVLLFLVAWKLATLILRKALDWTTPDPVRRPGGALLGLAKSALVLWVVLTAVRLSGHQFLTEHLVERSAFGRFTQERMPETLHSILPGVFDGPGAEPSPEPEGGPDDGSGDA